MGAQWDSVGVIGAQLGVIEASCGFVGLIGFSGSHQRYKIISLWSHWGLVRVSRAQWDSVEIIGGRWGSLGLSGAQWRSLGVSGDHLRSVWVIRAQWGSVRHVIHPGYSEIFCWANVHKHIFRWLISQNFTDLIQPLDLSNASLTLFQSKTQKYNVTPKQCHRERKRIFQEIGREN